jgi:RNA polymerase sigma-70 factor (ECF subfamily)
VSALPDEGKSAAASGLVASQLTALYKQYHAEVYAYCRRRLRNREEAEDATQVTFVKAFTAFRRGVVPDTESAWLFTIAKRVVLTRLEVTHRLRALETVTELDHFEAPHAGDRSELHDLQRAVEGLPEASRRAFVMREWQGLQYDEIADELGLERNHVGVILLRARRHVAKQLRAALNLGPASGLLRRGLEMLTADSAHLAAASAVAASAPVLLAVAPATSAVPVAHLMQPVHVSHIAAGAPNAASPTDSRFTLHGLADGSSSGSAVTVAARVAARLSPVEAPTATGDPDVPVGIVDPVVPTSAQSAPDDPVREVASDPVVPVAATNDQPEEGTAVEDVPVDQGSGSDAAPEPPVANEDGGGSLATPTSSVQPGQGDATADSTPGHTGDHPEQSVSSTAPGHAFSVVADAARNGNGPNAPTGNGNRKGNGVASGNDNGAKAEVGPPSTPPTADPPTTAANAAANGNENGNSGKVNVAPPAAEPLPPVADAPAANGNGKTDDHANGRANTSGSTQATAPEVAPAAPPTDPAPALAPGPPPASLVTQAPPAPAPAPACPPAKGNKK